MAFLRNAIVVVAWASLAACYDPSLRDCVRSCGVAADCFGDQQCANGFCVAPDRSCEGGADAEVGADRDADVHSDARTIDARPIDAHPIDAPIATVELRIEVKGRGSVDANVSGVSCSGPDGDCRFDVAVGTVVELTAIDGVDDFRRWRNDCEGQGQTCTLTIGTMRHAKAEFGD